MGHVELALPEGRSSSRYQSHRLHRVAIIALALVFAVGLMPRSAGATNLQRPEDVVWQHWAAMASVWAPVVQQNGRAWWAPRLVWYNYSNSTMRMWNECGGETAKYRTYTSLNQGGNSEYCNGTIYLDYAFHQYLIRVWGDYASGFIIAHEYAHHAQYLLGWLRYTGTAMELQADCYTGVYTNYAAKSRLADASDVYEGYRMAWHMNRAEHLYHDSGSHGSGQQRGWWFNQGYTSYDVSVCNSTYRYYHHTLQ